MKKIFGLNELTSIKVKGVCDHPESTRETSREVNYRVLRRVNSPQPAVFAPAANGIQPLHVFFPEVQGVDDPRLVFDAAHLRLVVAPRAQKLNGLLPRQFALEVKVHEFLRDKRAVLLHIRIAWTPAAEFHALHGRENDGRKLPLGLRTELDRKSTRLNSSHI